MAAVLAPFFVNRLRMLECCCWTDATVINLMIKHSAVIRYYLYILFIRFPDMFVHLISECLCGSLCCTQLVYFFALSQLPRVIACRIMSDVGDGVRLRGQRHDQRVSPLPSPQIDLIFGLSRRRAQRRVVICISLARRDEI